MKSAILILLPVILIAGCIGQDAYTGSATDSESETVPLTGRVASDFPLVRTQAVEPASVSGTNPDHSELLRAAPAQVIVNTNLQLSESSSMEVSYKGSAADSGPVQVSGTRLSRSIRQMGDGEYVISYTVCSDGGACEEGKFAFLVDSHA